MKKVMIALAAVSTLCAAWVATALFVRVRVPVEIPLPAGHVPIPDPVAIPLPPEPFAVPGPFFFGPDTVLLMVIVGLLATSIGLGVALLRSRRNAELEPRDSNLRLNDARLERIEHAIEAMAVEIERIGEMERSAARILATRPLEGEARVATPRPYPVRVITPH